MLAAAAALAFAVIVLGAYVRLKDAGLGCPDWPGCYGALIGVGQDAPAGAQIDGSKAWIELSHRYLAAALGLLVAAAAVLAFVRPVARSERILAVLLLALVIGQGLLGALTVTEQLQPAVVSAHLLGGMAILALLAAYCARVFAPAKRSASPALLRLMLAAAVAATFAQLALGAWVSANYAGIACGTEYPTCNGSWAPIGTPEAFALDRELGFDAAGQPLTAPALVAVHWAHRMGALGLAAIAAAAVWLLFSSGFRAAAVAVGAALLAQLALGILTVLSALALPLALLHNAGAAALVAALSASASRAFCSRTVQP